MRTLSLAQGALNVARGVLDVAGNRIQVHIRLRLWRQGGLVLLRRHRHCLRHARQEARNTWVGQESVALHPKPEAPCSVHRKCN